MSLRMMNLSALREHLGDEMEFELSGIEGDWKEVSILEDFENYGDIRTSKSHFSFTGYGYSVKQIMSLSGEILYSSL
jgi:hypothetical protein